MKRLISMVLALVMLMSFSIAFAAESFSLPLGIKYGMTRLEVGLILNHYITDHEDTYYSFDLDNVLPGYPGMSASLWFDYGDNEVLHTMKLHFVEIGKRYLETSRVAEFRAVEQLLTEKYGETEFIDDDTQTKYLVAKDHKDCIVTQRVVKCKTGGYVLVSHVVYTLYSSLFEQYEWYHYIEYEYIGEKVPFTDNKIHTHTLTLDDIL